MTFIEGMSSISIEVKPYVDDTIFIGFFALG